jgi:hypothetical protein
MPSVLGKSYHCYYATKALCGLQLNAVYLHLFVFLHCLRTTPSVCGAQLLLGEASPTCFAFSSVLWLGKQREGEIDTLGHEASQVPGTDTRWGVSAA